MMVATMSADWTHGQRKLDLHVVEAQCLQQQHEPDGQSS